ncbi:hypothetical protein BDV38DRAFT_279170 [Aspergillus pseudotamarii]|uniref:Uncharacterized protein n=1 Tax=Aspergillus pseudotamarii TaxID=132259 RepID=A0A5N6T4M1_ASPPS|nr:uncharacterized protein BDV38DRAFT_279170 [Aspergillus pseudotamarii]KAE8141264.1 hypothetical protein BDV38DRAFT_279170 [Aspergillus pseudotamarii]
MVDWANVRGWVAFVTSNVLGGVSPAKDWVKHLVPVLWPKDKTKPNRESEAALRMDLNPELVRDMLTTARSLHSQSRVREADMIQWEGRLERRAERLNDREDRLDDRQDRLVMLADRLGAREKDLRARDEAIRDVEDGLSALERTLYGLFSDIEGLL